MNDHEIIRTHQAFEANPDDTVLGFALASEPKKGHA